MAFTKSIFNLRDASDYLNLSEDTLERGLLYFFGEQAKEWILTYLDWIMVVLLILMVAGYIAVRVMEHMLHKEERK